MVKNDVFSMVGGLGGDYYQDTHEPKLFGMHSGSVLSGWNAGQKWVFFRILEVLQETFIRTHMSQSCLGCIAEGFLHCGQVMVPNRFGDIQSRTCVLGRK